MPLSVQGAILLMPWDEDSFEELSHEEREALYNLCLQADGATEEWLVKLSPKELRKYSVIEKFAYDMELLLSSLKQGQSQVVAEPSYILFYYPPSHEGGKEPVRFKVFKRSEATINH